MGIAGVRIAELLGWSTATVHVLHSRWSKAADTLLDPRARGGSHSLHLIAEQGRKLLAPFIERVQAGGMSRAAQVQQACQAQLGKAVAPCTVYRVIASLAWCWPSAQTMSLLLSELA